MIRGVPCTVPPLSTLSKFFSNEKLEIIDPMIRKKDFKNSIILFLIKWGKQGVSSDPSPKAHQLSCPEPKFVNI
jgi:hypothetical protein